MVQLGFNSQDYEKPVFGEPIKPDWYALVIESITQEATKNADGSYLEITLVVDPNRHPELAGRKLWDRLNIHNKTEKAQKIARGVLRKIQESCGKPVIADTDELIGSHVLAKVIYVAESRNKDTGEVYPAKNEIRDYKPIGEAGMAGTAAITGTSAAPAAATPAAAPAVPSWMRKPGAPS